jgi:hypothetical protein
VKNSFVLQVVQNSFVVSMWVHGISLVDSQRTCYHTKQFVQWFDLMLKGLAK